MLATGDCAGRGGLQGWAWGEHWAQVTGRVLAPLGLSFPCVTWDEICPAPRGGWRVKWGNRAGWREIAASAPEAAHGAACR